MSSEINNSLKNEANAEENKQVKEVLPGYTTIDQFTKDGFSILMEAIRISNSLPSGRECNFYRAHESFNNIVNAESNNILKQINSILRINQVEGNIRNRVLEEKTELMIEANDMILEKVANNIDEMNGIRKTAIEPVLIQTVSAQLPINGSWNRVNRATFSVSSSITSESFKKPGNAIRLLTGKNIVRPQKFFKDKVNNSSKYPWEPRIKEKPNSLKPLAIFLEETENGEEFSHPYEYELDKFTPLPEQLEKETPPIPLNIECTPLIEVNQPEQIEELVEELRNCNEFAVDLEHHSYRSFMGITCLMQISTREKDYLIDTLALRDKLYILNEVFTKTSIVKIFHGADRDIQWLQRDLSLYVVNMFDTYQAAKHLGYSGLSLAYLLQRFCNCIPNKQFQLADWRIRPLPQELKSYAREDTHYLIYIYHVLKNELIDKANGKNNILLSVLQNSRETCKRRYFKPVLQEDSHLDFYRKCKRLFDNRQLYALRELYEWRDQISRDEDESTGYVLPNHMLLQISEMLPREIQGILACCNPIPPLVRSNLLEIHQIILRAKEQPLEKPILKEDTRARGTTFKISKINVDSPLHCPHDLTKSVEFRDDLPTVLGENIEDLRSITNIKLEIENDNSIYTIFDTPENSDVEEVDEVKQHRFTFLGPFERYKLVKPFIQAEEERLASEKTKENEEKSKGGSESEKAIQEDTRTDEERIESIREHFLKLARKTVPEVSQIDPDQSLTETAGTKRKREPSLQDDATSESNMQTPIPNMNKRKFNPRKRKCTDIANGNSPNKIPKSNRTTLNQQKQKFKRKNWNPQKNQTPALLNNQQNVPREDNSNKQNYPNYNKQTQGHENHASWSQQGSNNFQQCDSNASAVHDNLSSFSDQQRGGQGAKRGKRKNRHFRGNQHMTYDQDFTAYDYSSVDFRQFQGGAGGTQRPQEFMSTFRSKGKKRKGANRGNRSSANVHFGRIGGRGR